MKTLNELKTYTVKCTYLGITAEIENVKADGIADAFQTLDTEFGANANEKYADVWKWSGSGLQDAANSFTSFDDALNWACGEALETGILGEGLGASGFGIDTFKSVNEMLIAAREEPLSMLDEDGEVVTDEADAHWHSTFDRERKNGDVLKQMDTATWEVEESGEFDKDAILEIVQESGRIEFEDTGDNGEIVDVVEGVATQNGYTLVVRRGDNDDYYNDFKEPQRTNPGTDEIQEALGVNTFAPDFSWENRFNQTESLILVFVRDADVDAAREAWNKSDIVFFAGLEEDFESGPTLETQEEFDAFAEGTGKFDGEAGWGYVEFDGVSYCKARNPFDDEPTMYVRDDYKETWSQL